MSNDFTTPSCHFSNYIEINLEINLDFFFQQNSKDLGGFKYERGKVFKLFCINP